MFLEQFIYPDGWGGAELPRDIVMHLAGQGWHVEVICGTEQYAPTEGRSGPDPSELGVVIHRVPALPGGRGDAHRLKLLRHAWFCAWASVWLFLRRPPDVFVAQTNPPAAIPLIALAARVWRRPFVLVAMDLYPEVMIQHGTLARGGALARFARAVFDRAYRSATRVVALGPVMAARIRAKGVAADRLAEISNWATGVLGTTRGDGNRMRAELGLRESFVIVYSGNLGVSHEFETLLQAVSLVRERLPRLRLVIFGDGVRLVEVRRLTRDLRLEQVVTFVPPVPAERLPESLGLADLGIVSLREGFEGLVVPSKLLGYMARAIPVLYIGPESDASQLVARHACGYCVRNGDASAAAGAIVHACENPERLDAMGRAARQAYETGMTREQSLAGYESVIRQSLHAYGRQAHS